MQKKPGQGESHLVVTLSGTAIRGTWEEILLQMKAADREWAQGSLSDFMASLARRGQAETGVVIPTTDRGGVHSRQRGSRSAADRPVSVSGER